MDKQIQQLVLQVQDLQQRLTAAESTNAQLTNEIKQQALQIGNLTIEQQIQQIEQNARQARPAEASSTTDTRGIGRPTEFHRNEESFVAWRIKNCKFVFSAFTDFEQVIRWAKDSNDVIANTDVIDDFGDNVSLL